MRANRLNIYIVLLTVAVSASLLQLGGLGNGLYSQFHQAWVNSSLQSHGCTDCGTPTVTPGQQIEFKPERITITDSNIDLKVVSIPLKNGTWEVVPKVANYAEGTSLVNEKEGNVGIFAHARPDAFKRIKNLQPGNEIIVYGESYKAIYKVDHSAIVDPTDVKVFYPEERPVLTLVTCEGLNDEHRYMVRAKLIKIEKNNQELTKSN